MVNPYVPSSSIGNSGERKSSAPKNFCPICEQRFPRTRRYVASFRCTRCETRIGFKPRLKYTLPALIVCSLPWIAVWICVKNDPSQLLVLGFWLMVPPIPAFFGPMFVSQAFGKPTAYNGLWWASADVADSWRSAWINHDEPRNPRESSSQI